MAGLPSQAVPAISPPRMGVRAPAVHGAIFTSFALCLVSANLAFNYHEWMCMCPFLSIPGGRS